MKCNSATRIWLLSLVALTGAALSGCASKGDEEQDPNSTATELYEAANRSMLQGAYENAILRYRQLQSRFPFGRHAEQAHLALAYCYYKNYDPDLSIATANRFIKTYPTHPHVDYAHYLKGLVNFSRNRGILNRVMPEQSRDRDQEYARLAFQSFAELIQRFPQSKYVEDASYRMMFLRNAMAAYEVSVANYYVRRKAYVAAANRAKHVVETFEEAPATGDALALMVEAYKALDLTQLSDDTLRVLTLNYPNHPYLTGLEHENSWFTKLWPFD